MILSGNHTDKSSQTERSLSKAIHSEGWDSCWQWHWLDKAQSAAHGKSTIG
jgi:hypothetical protein